MTPEQLASVRAYVGFTDQSTAVLRAFHPHVAPKSEAIMDDFYATIEAHPHAKAAITGGRAQVERLKKTLRGWLDSLLLGPHDLRYLEAHSRIGRVHVRINLPQEFMFTAVNRIRTHLLEIVDEVLAAGSEERRATQNAVNQILDLELAIMLDTYREDLVEKMRAQERLATIGELSATIAHELRNPLGTLGSSLFLLRKRVETLQISDPLVDKHHARIADQVRECVTMTNNLLDLARDKPLAKRQATLTELVTETLKQAVIPAEVHVHISAAPELRLYGDPEQLRHALSNLIRNAAEALHGKGNITISAGRLNESIYVDVSDDGPGVPPELERKVFELLFTSKASGTGLGLALARRICEAHGGSLTLEPSDKGACFRISLPEPQPGTQNTQAPDTAG
ncbi:MAG TPA: protoglobin domain-containing protein [Polyangiales bacterium]